MNGQDGQGQQLLQLRQMTRKHTYDMMPMVMMKRRRMTTTWSAPGATETVTTKSLLLLRAKRAILVAFQRDGAHIMMVVSATFSTVRKEKCTAWLFDESLVVILLCLVWVQTRRASTTIMHRRRHHLGSGQL